ncbi:MAG TPA: TonB-dependent receptor [Gemmatimonadaceae bacterium]|jgi:vitamin B12 transporter
MFHHRDLLVRLAVAASVLLAPVGSLAQGTARDTVRTAPVVVTATRSAMPGDRVPASVSVLGGEQLRREGITSVAEALRQVPGVALAQSASYGSATSLFIRGGESKFTKVLVDGVPVNDAGGAFDFSSLTTDNVDRIEIVRGPSSVLYGSDAVAGVVQIFTRRGTRGVHGELAARGGGFGTSDLAGALRGAAAPGDAAVDWSLGASRHRTAGYQAFNSAFNDNGASALLHAALGPAEGQLSLRYGDIALHFPTDGSGRVVDSNAVHHEDRLALGAGGSVRLSDALSLRANLASNDVHGVTDDQPDSPGDDQGYYYSAADRTRRRSGDLRLELALPRGSQLTVGGQVEREWQASATTSNFGPNGFTAARRTSGAYAQLLLEPSDRWTSTLGGRYEHNQRFGDFWTWRAAASARVTGGSRLRASAGTAFREPTFLENYGSDFVIGNPALAPEQSFSIDAGVEQTLGNLGQLSATWFANSFRNLIDYVYSATQPNYFNLARTRASGVELEGRAQLPVGLYADASFTYLDARVVTPGASGEVTSTFAANARLLRRPMHTFDAGVGFRAERFGVDIRTRRVGRRDDVFFAPDFTSSRVSLPAYSRVDLSGDVALVPARQGHAAAALTLRVDNLFDAHYTEAAGVNYDFARTDEATLRLTGYRASPRRILAGMRLSY